MLVDTENGSQKRKMKRTGGLGDGPQSAITREEKIKEGRGPMGAMIQKVADFVRQSKRVIVFTGAGVSTE
jgi:thiamine pyrophosphate-dependent acetolactate synthase large subunit-like protein